MSTPDSGKNNKLNDDSDTESLSNHTIKNKKKCNLIDSESEDEASPPSDSRPGPAPADAVEDIIVTADEPQTPEKKKKSRLRKISDKSDSDSDDNTVKPVKDTNVNESKVSDNDTDIQQSKLTALVDSDSEDESKQEEQIYNENIDEDALQKEQATRLKNICDSESSADETETQNSENNEPNIIKKPTKSLKKSGARPKEKSQKMTGKDAKEQMRQIKSFRQKMVRESRVSLPYHLPKQHTLQEFLKRRSLAPDVVEINTTTKFAIKMSSQDLEKAAERLKEREKEIEEFYKDEGEESEGSEHLEDEPDTTRNILKPKEQEEEVQPPTIEQEENMVSSEETSKIEELRNVLIQYSCGNESNMEQLVEQPEKMDCTEAESIPENSEAIPEVPEASEEIQEDVAEESPSEIQEIEEDYTECFTRLIQKPEIPQETPESKEDELEKKLNSLNPLIAIKKDFKPRLTDDGSDFIVLDDSLERSKGVSNLMKRFLFHTSNKSTPKKAHEVTEVTIKDKETTIIEMDHEPDEAAKKNLIPGLKFKKLKANLKEQIALMRLEEWKKKQEELTVEITDGEKTECGLEDKILDDEDVEDISEEESSESEDEEDDIILQDKPETKSAFLDNEAEESDDGNEEIDEDDDEESDEPDDESPSKKKPLKRIIQAFDEDSEDEENITEENDEEITAYQPQKSGLEKTPCKPIAENKDISTFLTPTFHLTALQGMNSTTKSLESPGPGIALSPDPSPLRRHPLLKTKLFAEPEDASLEDLENLCSGKFTGPTQQTQPPKGPGNGNFITQETQKTQETQENELLNLVTFDNDSLDEKLSDATNNSQNSQPEATNKSQPEATNKSQLEATPAEPITEVPTVHAIKFVIASSDEDDDEDPATQTKTKKLTKTKRKYIIDDISISEDEDTANQNDFSDDEMDEEEQKNVNYDSEENEVEYEEMEAETEETDTVTIKKARDYFEAEAELSGSDWDSADEDEKGLDEFEAEDGDADKISEKKLQRELGAIHAFTVLEEDKRDVRLLQELLLEDGELHGAGRERKFKWKNADSSTWDNEAPRDDDEEVEETVNELEWRKMRHEREMFLREQQAKQQHLPGEQEDLGANESQFMQLGREALEKTPQQTIETEATATTDPNISLPFFALTNKRGSFLARSETTLARVAASTRSGTGPLTGGAKNSRNFVFSTIQKTDQLQQLNEESLSEKKRKAEPSTPKILKKMRVAESPTIAAAPPKKINKKLL